MKQCNTIIAAVIGLITVFISSSKIASAQPIVSDPRVAAALNSMQDSILRQLQSNGQSILEGNKDIRKNTRGLNNLIGGYGAQQLKGTKTALFYQSPDAIYNELVGKVINQIINPTIAGFEAGNPKSQGADKRDEAKTLSSQAIYKLLTATQPSLAINNAMKIPAPLPTGSKGVSYSYLGKEVKYKTPPVECFNLNALLAPLQYNRNDAACAQEYLQFVTGQAMPAPVPNFANLSKKEAENALKYNTNLKKYLIAKRTLTSLQAIGISNLYYLYAQRLPQDTRKLEQSLPEIRNTPLYPEASPMQVENYLATRRFNDPNWYSMIQKLATPAELLRQITYLLRDTLYVNYQRQLLQQRELATLSAIELQNAYAQAIFVQEDYNSVVGEEPFGKGDDTTTSNNGGSNSNT